MKIFVWLLIHQIELQLVAVVIVVRFEQFTRKLKHFLDNNPREILWRYTVKQKKFLYKDLIWAISLYGSYIL